MASDPIHVKVISANLPKDHDVHENTLLTSFQKLKPKGH